MKILCAIVTYNREKLLKRCLINVLDQIKKPNKIIIINNGDIKTINNFIEKNKIEIINQKNVGSAGGWNKAINYALNNNFDFIWLMDDDGYPEINSLKILSENFDINFSCLSSVVINENNFNQFVFPMPYIDKFNNPILFNFKKKIKYIDKLIQYKKSNLFAFAHLFNGALINIKAIKKIGNVNLEYFMYGDEVDYYHRLRDYGPIYSHLKSIHYHPDLNKRKLSNSAIYYYIKNSIILILKYNDKKIIRIIILIINAQLRIIKKNGFIDLLNYLFLSKKKYFYSSIYRGLKKRIGKDMDSLY